MIFRVWGLILAISILSSCSYRWGYGERSLPGGYTKIAIPVFSNTSQFVGIEAAYTNALVHEFAKSKVARIVDKKNSEVFVDAAIVSVEVVHQGSRSIDSGNVGEVDPDIVDDPENAIRLPVNTVLTTEYRVNTNTRVTLRRTIDRKVLWQGVLRGERVYPAPQVGLGVVNSVNPLYNHNARINVIEGMSGDMMAEAHDRMTENF